MAITGKKSRFGFRIASNRLPYLSKDGGPSPSEVNYYPQTQYIRHDATQVGIGPNIGQAEFDQEIGGGLFPSGQYRTGYSGGGDISLQPRLAGAFGWLLYGAFGRILDEYDGSIVHEHAFTMRSGTDAGDLPWFQFTRLNPGVSSSGDLYEIHEDARIVSAAFNIPAQGLVTADLSVRSRVVGLFSNQMTVNRKLLLGLAVPSATTFTDAAEGGSATTLQDTDMSWDVGQHAGSTVYVAQKGLRDIVNNDATTLFISSGAAVEALDDYIIGVPVWFTATGGSTTTAVVGASVWADDEFNDLPMYISGHGWVLVTGTDSATGTITFAELESAVAASDMVGVPTKAISGRANAVRVPAELYNAASVNDWLSVYQKGTRRITRKIIDDNGWYWLYVDGEFISDVTDGDYIVVLGPIHPTGGTTGSVEDTANITVDNAYDNAYAEVWDAEGQSLGKALVLLTDGSTNNAVYLDGSLGRAPTASDSWAIYDQEIAFTFTNAESTSTVPITSTPRTHFKFFAIPYAGKKLPIRNMTLTLTNQALDPAQEAIVGAYESDDVTITQQRLELSFTQRIRSQTLYHQVVTAMQQLPAHRSSFSPEIPATDALVRMSAPVKIGSSTVYYGLDVMVPRVNWSLTGVPRLDGTNVVELSFTGVAEAPKSSDEVMVGPLTIAAASDVNSASGSIAHASLDAAALATTLDVDESDVGNTLVGKIIHITAGTGAGQVRMVSQYIDGAGSGTVVPHRPWTEMPDDTSSFTIEDHYAVVVLTNDRGAYRDDLPAVS